MFIIQRNLDENLNIIPGFTVVAPNVTTYLGATTKTSYPLYHRFVSSTYSSTLLSTGTPRPFENNQSISTSGVVPVCPVYTQTPDIKQMVSLISYSETHISQGTVFTAETLGNSPLSFIALGSCGAYPGSNSNLAMLFQ
jgi:hypothetical protein